MNEMSVRPSGKRVNCNKTKETCAHILIPRVIHCVPKSGAKIEITITTTNLIRINYYPLGGFNYRLSGANVANFNKIHRTIFEQQLFKNGTQKQKFPISKSRLKSCTQYHQLHFAQNVRHLHRHLYVSCADRTFSAAAELPVCRSCSVNLLQKSVQC